MFGKLVTLFLAFLSLSCARPNYVESSPLENQQGVEPQSSQFSLSNLHASFVWEKKPTADESGSLIIRIFEKDPLDNFPILTNLENPPRVVLWMPSMNHGSTPTQVEFLSPGTYRVSNVFFIMPGAWEIKIQLNVHSQMSETKFEVQF